jgi:uncharacterized protein
MHHRLAITVLALVLAGPALAQTPAARPDPATISLVGQGEARAAPDMATISLGVISQARIAREALAANTRAMSEAVQSLKQAGIADRDLQTSQFSVQPQYQQDPQGRTPPRIVGYQVSNRLTARVRDLTKLGDVLDRVVALGANSVEGPVFGLAEPQAARDAARKAAAEDALRRARIYADALGVRLGRVLSVSEQGTAVPRPQPMMMARTAAVAEAAAVPVEAGESTLTAQVAITWEIAQ